VSGAWPTPLPGTPAFAMGTLCLPCRDEDPELFFPIGTSGPALLQVEQAKAVCRPCPAKRACLEYALDTWQQGVWAATTDADRKTIRDEQARHTQLRSAA
jgi:WhiB family redox-sensing transcriptional regulator